MHDYLFTAEVVRFAFMFGVAVSMLLYERRHLTTGSIVVPGYIATFITMPTTLLATFLNAFISYWLVNKLLRRWFLLYGRTKFTVLASISILIQTLMLKLSPNGSWLWESNVPLLVGVGYVVPALIAHDMGRQGIRKTIKSVSLAGLLVAAPIVLALLADMPGINDLAPLRGGNESAIEVGWIPVAVLFSAAAAWGVSTHLKLRSGGFMGAAFVAILLGDPWQVVVMATVALTTYLLVTSVLMNRMILFGRRKFSAMLLISASLSWALLWAGGALFGIGIQSHMDIGSLALTPLIVPGLLANDAQRTSPTRVLAGMTIATTFVLSTTWWLQSVVEHTQLDLTWKILAAALTLTIFGKPLTAKFDKLSRRATPADRATAEPVVAAPAPQQPTEETTGWPAYQRWSASNAEAARAAEEWLVTLLGETLAPRTLPAVTGSPSPAVLQQTATESTTSTLQRLRSLAVATRSPKAPTRPVPQRAAAAAPTPDRVATTTVARTRPSAPPRIAAPVAAGPAKVPARRGEFDAVALRIGSIAPPTQRAAPSPSVFAVHDTTRAPMISTDQLALSSETNVPGYSVPKTPGAAPRAHTAAPGVGNTDPSEGGQPPAEPTD